MGLLLEILAVTGLMEVLKDPVPGAVGALGELLFIVGYGTYGGGLPLMLLEETAVGNVEVLEIEAVIGDTGVELVTFPRALLLLPVPKGP